MIPWMFALASVAFGNPDCPALDAAQPALQGQVGKRKLALLVGVGDYLAEVEGNSIDLVGPPNDAARLRDLLVSSYGFPADNVCMLTNEQATRANYERAWSDHLMRAEQGDTVVYFFAGHGSQTTDFDGADDETDGLDETILLHDSRVPGGSDELVDDEFNKLLADLYEKTWNITVLIDACNSGTATRGPKTRNVPTLKRLSPSERNNDARGDYEPAKMRGVVAITAAEDGTPALERGGQGVFTNALLRSLEAKGDGSWEQVSHVIPRWIAAQQSPQVPTFEGQLDRLVFGSKRIQRNHSWPVVRARGDEITLRGPTMPGWTEGAVVEIFEDGNPKRKARVKLTEVAAMEAKGTLFGSARKRVTPGDFGVLESPGTDSMAIRVRFVGSVPLKRKIIKAISGDRVLKRTIRVVDTTADFEVSTDARGNVEIWGSEGVRRNLLPGANDEDAYDVAATLGLHARQASLLALSGEPNDAYPHDVVLGLRVLSGEREGCEKTPYESAAKPVSYVEVPMCNSVKLEVTLQEQPQQKMYLGILYLSNDGSITVWPRGNTTEVLRRRGDSATENLGFVKPPLDAPDRILVFGSHEPVAWSKLAQTSLPDVETVRVRGHSLENFVTTHVSGARGIDDEAPTGAGDAAWTASYLQLKVVGDPSKWTDADRTDSRVCARRRDNECE